MTWNRARIIERVHALRALIRADRAHTRVTLTERLRAWRHGWMGWTYKLYGRSTDTTNYVSAIDGIEIAHRLTSGYREILDDKLCFSGVCRQLEIPSPRTFGLVHAGRIVAFEGDEVFDHLAWLKGLTPCVLKPCLGEGGRAVKILTHADGQWTLNGRKRTPQRILRMVQTRRDAVVQQFVHQGEFARNLNPKTTNTLRILTFLSPDTNQIEIGAVTQRVGSSSSFPVDNVHEGEQALCAPVDVETGTLGLVVRAESGRIEHFDVHPETNVRIRGTQIPNWPTLRNAVLLHARKLPFIKLAAWDVVYDDDRVTFLEGNPASGLSLFQLHEGLLNNPRLRVFYRKHGAKI